MNSDDSSRNMHYSSNRKPIPSKPQVYSPSTNYNFNGSQSQHGNHGNHGNQSYGNQGYGNQGYGNQQRPHRKPNQFKRDNHGAADRLAKQNDTIIKLLKEIRDRLPAPAVVPGEVEETVQEQPLEAEAAQQDTAMEEISEQQDQEALASPEAATAAVNAEVSDDELDEQLNGNL